MESIQPVIPYLTVGHGRPVDELRTAEKAVQPQLLIEADATATTVTLMTEQSAGGRWATAASLGKSSVSACPWTGQIVVLVTHLVTRLRSVAPRPGT
jgi:hypothetical protein